MGRLDITKKNTEALVTFTNVSKSFGATNALIDCNIEFQKGEIHSLVGENGAGKSTLGKIILGAYRLDSGVTHIDGEEVVINSPDPLELTPDSVPSTCSGICDGIAVVNVTGGITPYSYNWLGNETINKDFEQI